MRPNSIAIACLALSGALALACGGGDSDPDARRFDATVIDAISYDTIPPDADPPDATLPDAIFDHFVMTVAPASVFATRDFTLTVTAYSSADESVQMTYNGTISVTASAGVLSGETTTQAITGGTATLTLQNDSAGTGVTLTATDDTYATITGTSAAFDIFAPGDDATERQVVINEVNWFGNGDATDEWIELRNLSGGALSLAEWTLEGAGSSGSPIVAIDPDTTLADGAFLLIATKQGADSDGNRTSLTGVSGVQLQTLDLADGGEQLILKDPDGTVIDSTPTGAWAAGHAGADYSMERRDEVTGGGYTDGTVAASWYSWSSLDGTSTTSADTSDMGTPGAANSDPDIFHHFTFVFTPTYPVVGTDFDVTITAYSSTDDSVVIASYDEAVSVTASAATLSGETDAQAVTDDIYPGITGTSAAFDIWVGDRATTREVVINEVNWFGNSSTYDEWIELRNVSGRTLNLNGWTIEGAGTSTNPSFAISPASTLADGAYLLIANQQGAGDSLELIATEVIVNTGINLANGGEQLTLTDANGDTIDQTPLATADWPAGDNGIDWTMERRDNLSGGGYADGAGDGQWYTWNPADGNRDYTNPVSRDKGTPGAANSNPAATFAVLTLPYSTGLEPFEPTFSNPGIGTYIDLPLSPLVPRNGAQVASIENSDTSYRYLDSDNCITLNDDSTIVNGTAWGMAGNAGVITARLTLVWFSDATCTTSAGADSDGATLVLPAGDEAGEYGSFNVAADPPDGATHFLIRIGVIDDGSGSDDDDFAVDDIIVTQP